MYKNFHLIIFLLILFSPISTYAAITINEIAWMGGVDSANHEWIELYNSGSEVINVDGWTLNDGVNLNINLIGSVPSNSYVVLERSSEESAPSSAFLIYTGALVNSGVTLTLRNSTSEIVDQVSGGESWQSIGGDNTTKETAQYTTKGWVTDVATPGKVNRTGRVEVTVPSAVVPKTKTDSVNSSSNKIVSVEKTKTVMLGNSESVLQLSTDIQDVAYVNQIIPFKVMSTGVGNTINNSLVYTWNFGDTYTTIGSTPEHSYAYPGTYVVTVNAKFAKNNQTIRKEITILPVSFSITKNDDGDIQIQNDSPYDVDISGYVVRGLKDVVFPVDTIILPKSTITIAKQRLDIDDGSMVAFYDKKLKLLTSNYEQFPLMGLSTVSNILDKTALEEDSDINFEQAPVSLLPTRFLSQANLESDSFNFVTAVDDNKIIDQQPEVVANYATTALVSKTEKKNSVPENWPYITFIGLLLLALIGLYFGNKK